MRRELIDLCRLTSVDGARARVLYDGGKKELEFSMTEVRRG